MNQRTILKPDWLWVDKFGFAPAVKVGDMIHTCGMIAFDADGTLVGEGDCYQQSVKTFENIRDVLALGGASMDDVVKITTFLPDLALYGAFKQARTEAFPAGVPASTAVGSTLLLSELLVEIEAVAIVGGG